MNEILGELFGRYGYATAFIVLLLCGIGLPLPEEVPLIGAGILVHEEEVRFLPMVVVCGAAILLGDLVPYTLGRRYGLRALKVAWVRRILRPERFARMERRFAEHGGWATFACRFFAGLRLPGYFIAGTMGMGVGRFLLLDALGVAITVPISIYLGRLFGGSVERLEHSMAGLHQLLAFLVVSMAVILLMRSRSRRRSTPPGRPSPPEVPGP